MEWYDALFIAVIFYGVYYITDPLKKNKKMAEKRQTNQVFESLLHQYRKSGVDADKYYDILAELVRRGWTTAGLKSELEGLTTFQEMMAKAEYLLQGTAYVPREKGEPTEDRAAAKSTLEGWARYPEQQNGDN
jgi:hypothetical protein